MFTNASRKDEADLDSLSLSLPLLFRVTGGMNQRLDKEGKRNVEQRGIRGTVREYTGLRKHEKEEEEVENRGRMRRRSTGPEGVQLDAERNWNGAEMLS